MLRRLLPTLLTVGVGLLALGWGLVSLQRIFAHERDDARTALRTRRASLEQVAEEAFRQALARRLSRALPALEAARRDPLASDAELYLREQGVQLLPRKVEAAAGEGAPARARYESLRTGSAREGPTAWGGRVTLVRQVEAALARRDAALVEAVLQAFAGFSDANPIRADHELPLLLYLVERLADSRVLPPSRVRAMVRGGPDGKDAPTGGLQRALLARRGRLTRADFGFLLTRLAELSSRVGVPHDDLLARAQDPAVGALVFPPELDGPALVGGRWYVEPHGDDVRGVAVDPLAVAAEVEEELRRNRLVGTEARVRLHVAAGALVPLEQVRLPVELPAWTSAEHELEARYRLKSLLVAACGVLALALLALTLLSQRRKHRFLALKSDFVATVSHELRTPLASIRLLAETLENRLGTHPDARDYPARIVREVEDLSFLVENILSYNRLEKGRWRPHLTRVRLEEILATLRADLATLPADVELTVEADELELEADPSLLRLVLGNLARNACAYNTRRPVRLSLTAHARPRPTLLLADNGIGIPEEAWESVFGDFYRLKGPDLEVRGSGLGLALCRRVMALHGGSIRVAASSPTG
ncbi:MAG: HAMP domain-containing histidine kinase, partial [Myxococcaceae bacterium]|nr:HAMP domain-containing histidine kinase [Myxococcaceae bacterium]